jgi:heme/copper-type cytochrome/quinol oxidase subunit 1
MEWWLIAVLVVLAIWLVGFVVMEAIFHLQSWRLGERWRLRDEATTAWISVLCFVTALSANWPMLSGDIKHGSKKAAP